MRGLLAAAAFAGVVVGGLPCSGKDVRVGETSVVLTAPPGQCELDSNQPADRSMLQAIGAAIGTNTLLAMFADCKQLADWRAGRRSLLEDFAQYQVLTSTIDRPPERQPAQALKELCTHLREEGEKMMTGMASDLKQRVEQALKNVEVNQLRFLGVVADDADACYGAMVQRAKAQTGKDVTIVGLSASAFVKGKLVYYYLFAPYRSGQTVSTLLAKQKLNVAAFLAANK